MDTPNPLDGITPEQEALFKELVTQSNRPISMAPKVKAKVRFHVCVPLYRGIPKQAQTGWVRYDAHHVAEWDNTTDIAPWLKAYKDPTQFDKGLYCGVCGRAMVKKRNQTNPPTPTAKLELV